MKHLYLNNVLIFNYSILNAQYKTKKIKMNDYYSDQRGKK